MEKNIDYREKSIKDMIWVFLGSDEGTWFSLMGLIVIFIHTYLQAYGI
jgi:hypothetical protein